MDPQIDLPELIEDLEVNIDELTHTLAPLLTTPVSTTATSLPLLDKAKLYVLAAYSIESLLYSTLQASGANAKEHAVFKELARLKGYFGKIKAVEDAGAQPPPPSQKSKLDVGAAARFIRHGLAGNAKYDLERAERQAKERARASLKARQINRKFDDDDQGKDKPSVNEPPAQNKRAAEDVVAPDAEEGEEGEEDDTHPSSPRTKKIKLAPQDSAADERKSKRARKLERFADAAEGTANANDEANSRGRSKRKLRGKKTAKHAADGEGGQDVDAPMQEARSTTSAGAGADGSGPDAQHAPRKRGRPRKAK